MPNAEAEAALISPNSKLPPRLPLKLKLPVGVLTRLLPTRLLLTRLPLTRLLLTRLLLTRLLLTWLLTLNIAVGVECC